MKPDFSKAVYRVVKKIPKGKTLSYKKVAERAGYPKAWRAVGNVLNKSGPDVPCHRVIKSNGDIGGYSKGKSKKKKLLEKERNSRK